MPIIREAVEHRPNAEDGHAVSRDEVVLRLRARRGDCARVTLVYIDKYRYIFDFHGHFSDQFHAMPMERIASDAWFDIFEACLVHDLLAFYRSVIRLRRATPALLRGHFQEIVVDNARGLYGFRRRLGAQEVRVYLNKGEQAQEVEVGPEAFDLLGDRPLPAGQILLGPRSGAVVEVAGG